MMGEIVGQVLDLLATHPVPSSIPWIMGRNPNREPGLSTGTQLGFIRPGKSVENAFLESFIGRLPDPQ